MLNSCHYLINSKTNILLVLLFISIIVKAQNLVPNYSFELPSICYSSGGGGLLIGMAQLLIKIFNIHILLLVAQTLVVVYQ